LRRETIEEEFLNCSTFHISLYNLRNELYIFIRRIFTRLIEDLAINSNASMKQTILDYIRTVDANGESPVMYT